MKSKIIIIALSLLVANPVHADMKEVFTCLSGIWGKYEPTIPDYRLPDTPSPYSFAEFWEANLCWDEHASEKWKQNKRDDCSASRETVIKMMRKANDKDSPMEERYNNMDLAASYMQTIVLSCID